jgi:hypothetical protein
MSDSEGEYLLGPEVHATVDPDVQLLHDAREQQESVDLVGRQFVDVEAYAHEHDDDGQREPRNVEDELLPGPLVVVDDQRVNCRHMHTPSCQSGRSVDAFEHLHRYLLRSRLLRVTSTPTKKPTPKTLSNLQWSPWCSTSMFNTCS